MSSTARNRQGRSGGSRRRASSRPVRAGARGAVDSRPGRRTTRRPPRSAGTPGRGPRFTGRAVLLGALVLLLAMTLAGPVRQYVAGRQELAELAAEQEALTQRAADLQAQLDRQADPAYIAQQARERLTYVLPGDRLVVVGDAGDAGDGAAAEELPDGGTPDSDPVPWYEGLLGSLAAADGEPADGAPARTVPAPGTGPAPSDPVPSTPSTSDPAPPVPSGTAPSAPAPSAPSAPVPAVPAPSDTLPADNLPTDTVPTGPVPADPPASPAPAPSGDSTG
ncbi:septum formation initiator family protein [Modestobacter sp. URMC 112]